MIFQLFQQVAQLCNAPPQENGVRHHEMVSNN